MSNVFLKKFSKNKPLYIMTIIFIVAFILAIIAAIIWHEYGNVFEMFGNYSPEKCENKMKDLIKDELYEKVKKVDIVYMWVDGEDTEWQKNTGNTVNSRNRSNNELIYSLRSIAKFIPWHEGRIFIVTPNQIPPKLKIDNKNITVIDQNTLLPPQVNKTANSFMIEIYLHKIPGLSENFIYMNDDYFFGQPLVPSDFFTLHTDGKTLKPKFYSNKYVINGGTKQSDEFFKKKQKLWLAATYNSNGAIQKKYGDKNRYYLEHAPYMFNKTWCEEAYTKWKEEFESMFEHTKRHWKDYIYVLMYRYYCLEEGKPCELVHEMDKIHLQLITNNNDSNIKFYKKVTESCPKFFTLNDEYSKDEVKTEMTTFLEEFFHEKSKYEI